MTIKKRLMALCLVLVLLVSMLPGSALAAHDVDWSGSYSSAGNNNVTTVALPVQANRIEEAWFAQVGNGTIVIVDDYVYTYDGTNKSGAIDNSGTLYKINKDTGEIKGSLTCQASTGYYYSYMVYGDGRIYVGTQNKIFAVDIDSFTVEWSVNGNGKFYPVVQFVNNCVVTNGLVLNAKTGATVKTLPGNYDWANGVENGGMFYVADANGVIRAFDTDDWTEKDALTYNTGKKGAGVAFFNGRLYWSDTGSKLHSVELDSDGTFKDGSHKNKDCGISTVCTPVISNGRLYLAGSKDGEGVVGVFKAGDLSLVYIAGGAVEKIQSTPIVRYVNHDGPSLQSVNVPMAVNDGNYVIVQDYGSNYDSKLYVLYDTDEAASGTLSQLIAPVPANFAYEQLAFDKDGALYCTNDEGYLHKYVVAAVKTPVIGGDLSTDEVEYNLGDEADALIVTASSPDGGELGYQWQSKTGEDDWKDIRNAVENRYTPNISAEGTTYYRCIVTNTIDGESAQTISAAAMITVTDEVETPRIYVEKVKTCDDIATLDVYIAGNPGIIAAKLYVDYDSEKLELTNVEDAKLLKGFLAGEKLSNDPFLLLWEDSLASENNTANGKLVTLSFKAKEGFSGVESAVSISYAANDIYDTQMSNVDFLTEAGSVAVGHKWSQISYVWADDYSSCTAARSCTVDGCDEEEKETAQAEKTVNNATDTENGSIVYTAEFENTAFAKQTHTEIIYAIKAVFSAGKMTAKAGEEVTVGIYIAENPGIIAAKLYVDYDNEKLELTKVEDAKLLNGFLAGEKLGNDPFLLLWEDSLADKNNTANGKLADLTFKVKDDCEAGDVAVISVSFSEDDVYDFDLNNVEFRTESGSVTIAADEGGDTPGGDTPGGGTEGGGTGEDGDDDKEDDSTIEITFTLKTHKATWIRTHTVTLEKGATVADAFRKVLSSKGLTYTGTSNYVKSITYNGQTLGEFDEGPNSGWKYMVNGVAPGVAMNQKELEDGDDLVWYYVTDYTEDTDRDEGGGFGGSDETEDEETEESGGGAGGGVTIAPEATVSGDKATANVGASDINNALEEAKKDETVTNVTIAPEVKGDVNNVAVELPKNSVGDIAESGLDLTVETDIADVKLPAKALEDVSNQKGQKVSVSAEKAEDGAVNIAVAVDGKSMDKVNGGIVVTMPAEDTGKVLVIVNEDGSETVVKKSVAGEDGISAVLEGSATVKLVDNKKEFKDVAKHWGASAIEFATSRELFNGVDEGVFDPDGTMTRAMLVTVLHRLEGEPEHGGHNHGFEDVAHDQWYSDAVAWANELGIVEGHSDEEFDPHGEVTREQIAVILHRYAEYLEMSTHHKGDMTQFHDHHKTSDWALEANTWAVGAGLINGKDGNRLDPTSDATRAEVATILERLVGLMME